MDIEVIESNEYIRTEKGHISKNLTPIPWIAKDTTIDGDLVVKHSKNIIDLIEEGDYVNGFEVITIYGYDKEGNDKDRLGICEVDNDYAYYKYLEDINIKTILTHEQYERNCYRLEE